MKKVSEAFAQALMPAHFATSPPSSSSGPHGAPSGIIEGGRASGGSAKGPASGEPTGTPQAPPSAAPAESADASAAGGTRSLNAAALDHEAEGVFEGRELRLTRELLVARPPGAAGARRPSLLAQHLSPIGAGAGLNIGASSSDSPEVARPSEGPAAAGGEARGPKRRDSAGSGGGRSEPEGRSISRWRPGSTASGSTFARRPRSQASQEALLLQAGGRGPPTKPIDLQTRRASAAAAAALEARTEEFESFLILIFVLSGSGGRP